jgi:hypothetical protein
VVSLQLSKLLQAHARPQYDQYMADLMQVHRKHTTESEGQLATKQDMELQFRLRERMVADAITTNDEARAVISPPPPLLHPSPCWVRSWDCRSS